MSISGATRAADIALQKVILLFRNDFGDLNVLDDFFTGNKILKSYCWIVDSQKTSEVIA